MSTSRLSRPLDLANRAHMSRCFRTGPDGRIALTNDWSTLLHEVRGVGRFALQTRHTFARLVALTAMPELVWCPERRSARTETGELLFNFDHWHRAWGFLRTCNCCASPGRIEVRNATGREFLQFCAMSGSDSLTWANLLGTFLADQTQEFSARADSDSCSAFPILPRSAVRLPSDIDELATILIAFGDAQIPVGVTLCTAEAFHRREFVPRHVTVDDSILSAGENGTHLQLALPTVRSLALTTSARGWALHVVGADDALLLTFSAASDPFAAAAWQDAIRAAFPILR